jgi:hypothetical protein
MTTIATVQNGRLDIPAPSGSSDGSLFEVSLRNVSDLGSVVFTEEDFRSEPASINSWIAKFMALEPVDISDEEWDAIRKDREEYRAWCLKDAAEKEARRKAANP